MAESDRDDSRTVVKTYVPAYQRDEWDDHADELDMSRSEFVRAMVQAGRRGFEGEDRPATDQTASADPGPEPEGPRESATDLESAVLEALSGGGYLSWDDLLAAVTDDIEAQLEETLQELQETGQVRYSGRNGGYTLE
jgi:hypothetical protein